MKTTIQKTNNLMTEVLEGQVSYIHMVEKWLLDFNRGREEHYSAFEFMPLLQKGGSLTFGDKISLQFSTNGSLVLMENDLMKVNMIYWAPGKESSIHGHPDGGCLFKVLEGQLRETRYTSLNDPIPMEVNDYSENGIAYIHDTVAIHSVCNPYEVPAYSIHMYSK